MLEPKGDAGTTTGKVIKDGKVAVLISPGFGAGWSTWNYSHPECLFDPEIVEMVLANRHAEIAEFAEQKYGEGFYAGGARDLEIEWVPQGTEIYVHEYDGSESLKTRESDNWTAV